MNFEIVDRKTIVTEKAIAVDFIIHIQLKYSIDKQIFEKAVNDVLSYFQDRPGFPVAFITIN